MTSVRTHYVLAALAITALVGGLPSAAAQTVAVDNQNTEKSIPQLLPEIDEAPITLAFIYSFPNPVSPVTGVTKTTATATLDVTCADPTNIIVTGPRSMSFQINPASDPQGTDTAEFQFDLFVSVTRQLQGLKRLTCEYTVQVEQVDPATGNIVGQSNELPDSFTVSAKYYGLIQSKVSGQIKKTGPQKEISFPLTLDNFGNARTRVQFEILERPGGKKWQAVVPDDVILDSPYDGGPKTSDTANFQVTTTYKNGWNNEQGSYRIGMKVFAADDPTQTAPDLAANVLIRVRGVYVPTLEPFLLVGAMLVSALVLRRQPEE